MAILSENRPEWATTDFACFLLGAAVVPIYTTLTAQQSAYIVADSGAKVIFVSTAAQLKKVLSTQGQTGVERIVVMDAIGGSEAICMKQLMNKGPSGRDPELERVARSMTPDDLASIIYTSGTTGRSKGVQLTHGNLTSNVSHSLTGFDVGPGHISLSFLPLSHVTARHVDIALLYNGVTLAYCPFFEDLPQALREVRRRFSLAFRACTKRSTFRWKGASRAKPSRRSIAGLTRLATRTGQRSSREIFQSL